MNAYTLNPQAVALNRFGLGARFDQAPPLQPKTWLMQQLAAYQAAPESLSALKSTADIAAGVARWRQLASGTQDAKLRQDLQARMRRENRTHYVAAANARVAQALSSETPFMERLVHFWANHFAVSADKVVVVPFVGTFEAEVIRTHVMGNFADLLLAAEHHAAMLVYLDQATSVGPNSPLANGARQRSAVRVPGLNENLAREILELHTLGVRSGYTQNDVTEFARALTGWSVGGMGAGPAGNAEPGAFVFAPALHEPGVRHLLGRSYAQRGEAQAVAILRDLAQAPATARHIATKLARHFCGDDPPAALIERLAAAFLESRGELPAVYRALIDSPEVWSVEPLRFKTPWEWMISTLRGLGVRPDRPGALGMSNVLGALTQLGQPIWIPGSPAGWSDVTSSWASPDALYRRVEIAGQLAARVPPAADPCVLLERLLLAPASAATRSIVAGAESETAGLALLLVSPEFQRR